MNCKLCNQNEANQTGSHLLSAFFVKSMLGKRGEEIGHLITGSSDFDYRKNVGAESIIENYILCQGCERRLSSLEDYISREFVQKIDEERFKENFPIINKENLKFKILLQINPIAFKLIIYSILWHASLSNKLLFKSFNLPDKIMEDLRSILDRLLPSYKDYKVGKQRSWLNSLYMDEQETANYPFLIIKGDTADSENNRNSIFLHPKFNHPYHLLLNEYLILFFTTSSNVKLEDDFFRLKEEYSTIEKVITKQEENIEIIELNHIEWDRIIKILKDALVKQKLDAIYKKLASEFFQLNGHSPDEQEMEKLVKIYLDNQESKK